jgi:hypothetical protein
MTILDEWRKDGWTFHYERERGAVVRRHEDEGKWTSIVCEGIEDESVGECIVAALSKEQSNDAG